ncbi:MAG: type IV pilus assembly protein PilV [Alphaproteobacteria bacterium]|jgi:type IV pilus assembly protein PilV
MRNIEIRHTQQFDKLHRQQGVGMIEVLITLVILAVGLLGVASLQFVGSFSNKEALARTQAVLVSDQMTERLRASTVASTVTDGFVINNNYVDPDLYNFNNLSCASTTPAYDCHCLVIPAEIPNCQTNECVAAELAIFDAYQMSCSVVRENANATLEVTCNDNDASDVDACTAGSIHRIVVKWPVQSWRDDFKKANTNCNVDDSTEFDCVVKEVAL